MSFTKHTNVEAAEVLSPEEHREIEKGLHEIDMTSAVKLTIDERKTILDSVLDNPD